MNQILTILLFAFLLIFTVCCDPKTKSNAVETTSDTAVTAINDSHNSSNSLDINGVYFGVLPCADCEGIEIEITLKQEMTFLKRTKYLGKNGKVFDETGTYSWNTLGNTITLSGIKDGPNQYFVGENLITQLDLEGKKIIGDLAGKYQLWKEINK